MNQTETIEIPCGRAHFTLTMEAMAELLKLPSDVFITNICILPEDAAYNRFSIILAGPGLTRCPEGQEAFQKTLTEIRSRDGR